MKLYALAAIAVATMIATPALAGHCPKDMKAIDAALAKHPSLSSTQMTEVAQLRAEGERLHKGKDHGASLASLEKAMKILGIEH